MSNDAATLDDNPGLLRQRRNLITTSAIILFVEWAGMTFNTQYSVLGVSATITNPTAVSGALWVLWGYWLYRYYLYYKEARIAERFSAIQADVRRQLVTEKASEIIALDSDMATKISYEAEQNQRRFTGVSCDLIESVSYREKLPGLREGWVVKTAHISTSFQDNQGGVIATGGAGPDICIARDKFRRYECQVLRASLIQRSHLSQYWLPFLLSVPVLVLIWLKAIVAALDIAKFHFT